MRLMRPIFVLAAALVIAGPAAAQMREEVRFEAGNFGTMIEGSITGQDYFDHVLRANAGQELFVELMINNTDGNGTIYFNILPPGSTGEAIYNGSMDGNTARITLPESGPYTIRTYLMGNDEDTGRTVAYNLDVSIQ